MDGWMYAVSIRNAGCWLILRAEARPAHVIPRTERNIWSDYRSLVLKKPILCSVGTPSIS